MRDRVSATLEDALDFSIKAQALHAWA